MTPSSVPDIDVCPICHQPILSTYYYCPNCGYKLSTPPLSTTVMAQLGLYAFSIILPFIAYIMVTRWQGIKYFKSTDPKTKQIGAVACSLLFLSTILGIYLTYVWTEEAIQSSVNSINADFS